MASLAVLSTTLPIIPSLFVKIVGSPVVIVVADVCLIVSSAFSVGSSPVADEHDDVQSRKNVMMGK